MNNVIFECGYHVYTLTLIRCFQSTLLGDKVNMFTHTYPHKSLRKIKVVICNHQVDRSFHLWPDVRFAYIETSMVIHDTECPY